MDSLFRRLGRLLATLSLLAAIALCITPQPATAASVGGWEITKIEGRDYVSVDSLKRLYNFTKMSRKGTNLVLENAKVIMVLKIGGYDCLMNNVKFVLSDRITTQGDKTYISRLDLAKVIIPVLRPEFINGAGEFRTVILDPGHGGHDAGATNALGQESNYTLKVALLLKGLLQEKGFKVVMTRDSDVFVSLQERVNIANAVTEKAVYISIHFNSSDGRTARGIETFTLSPPGVAHYGRGFKDADSLTRAGNEHDSENIALATAIHGTVLHALKEKTLDRGIKRARFSVLSGVRHPAVLFEGGFVSHPYEARLISLDLYQNTLAKCILSAVVKYRLAVGRKPTTPN